MQETTAAPLDAKTKVVQRRGDHKNGLRLWLGLLTCTSLIEVRSAGGSTRRLT